MTPMAADGGAALRLDRVCRGCLREAPRMNPLSSPADPPLGQMLIASTQLQISENDGLPYQICSSCTNQLSTAFSFKQMCQQSDAKLRHYISKINSSRKCFIPDVSDKIKEEKSQIADSNDIINFDVNLEHYVSTIKEEPQTLFSEIDNKLNLGLSTKGSSTEKCIQTKFSDFVQTLYNCSDCGKKFSSLVGISNHMKFRHNIQELHPCKECDKIYNDYDHYKKHYSEMHQKKSPNESSASPSFECQICKKSYFKLNQLKHHMVSIHGKKKIFNCEKCQQSFNKIQNFERHKTNCDKKEIICNKLFSNTKAPSLHKEEMHIEEQDLKSNVISDEMKDSQNRENINDSPILNGVTVSIKEEPLDELLAEAERETQILNDNLLNNDNCIDEDEDFLSLERFSENGDSDASEYLESLKLKRKVGRPCKKSTKFKLKNLKPNNENNSNLKYQCTMCSKRFSTSVGLKIHSSKHYTDLGLLHSCEFCSETFSKLIDLRKHEQSHASATQINCSVCHRLFHREEDLDKHMWQHMEKKPHQCDKCDRSFLRLEHLSRHNIALHSGKIKNPKTAFCPICTKGFTTEKYLETHMRIHTGDKTFTCKVCDKSFNTKWHLKEHSKWHSAEKPFLCSECGQRFIRNDYLITHMRRHNGEKPYKCRYCGKGFPRATDLTVHERYHTGEKTHLCTICGKGFQRQYNLTVHLRVHTGEKPYVCSYCGKRFAQGNDLKSHIRRHTGERFNCEICGEGFIQGYHLTQHKRSIHGLQCVSHIRRVEKHIQSASQNQTKSRSQSPQSKQSNDSNSEVQANNIASKKDDTTSSSREKPIMLKLSTKIENESVDMTEHDSISFQSQISAVQSGTGEVDLSQRSHTIPPLMAIVPLALFPPMHSRI